MSCWFIFNFVFKNQINIYITALYLHVVNMKNICLYMQIIFLKYC